MIIVAVYITHWCSSNLPSLNTLQEWIYQQILTVAEPLHPTLPSLLQEFVASILLPSTVPPTTKDRTSLSSGHSPFSAEEVLRVFQVEDGQGAKDSYSIPTQLLMLFYVLLYQDCRLSNLKTLRT